ncbi:MAG TPA: M14 metallopeptidase family protein [Longimicrobiales bacterium]|nr:M14 metallopeptidase family protein [Longimicrobiales bacterium]
MPRCLVPALCGLLLSVSTLSAQHVLGGNGPYDPAVPTPRAALGYELGEHFTQHHRLMKYAERLVATSRRVRLDTTAVTFEGREVLLAIITSERNQQNLAQIKRAAQSLADPRALSAGDLANMTATLPTIVWLGFTVHGGEASGVEAALAMMYQLAAGQDAETRLILDSAVVLIDPVQNPDGHERHAQDVLRARSALWTPPLGSALIHQGTWPGPRTNHYYFDMNRDWITHSQPETRGRIASMLEWYPHVAVDLHEMGSNSTYFFPPPMDPVNKNIPAMIRDWWDVYAVANASAFDARGWSYFRREGYDEFYPGYTSSWPIYVGAVGMTYEQASSAGGAIRRTDGTVLTLREAASHHYTTAWATALTSARLRARRVSDFISFRQSAVTEGARGPVRAIVFERDETGRADSLAQLLLNNGIQVQRLRAATELRGARPFAHTTGVRAAAGSYVVDLAQPQGRLARVMLEPDAQLDSVFIREELERRETAQGNRFYDVTAWAMPYMYRLRAWTSGSVPGGVEMATSPIAQQRASVVPPARYGYAIEPGSDAGVRMLAALLADSVRVAIAQRGFRVGDWNMSQGAFVVRVASNDASVHDKVRRHAAATGANILVLQSAMVDEGTDLGSNSVVPVRAPRIALVGGSGINGNSFGFTWYTFDQQLRYPVTTVDINALANTIDEFNVVIIPSAGAAIDGTLGETGRARLGQWVRAGGVLITLDGSTNWLASERVGISRLRARRDTTRADNEPGAALPAAVPGAIVRALSDTLSFLTIGVRDRELPVLIFSDRIYRAPNDVRYGEVVLRYAPQNRLRMAGYLWPEVPQRLAGSPYLWTERVGRGRVIAFAGDPNFRAMWRGLLPIFANAALLGASF